MIQALGLIIPGILDVLDKVIPDPNARAKAKQELAVMAANGELKHLEAQVSMIVAEAKSNDPWTSRARPAFLWVMYVMILSALPMGLIHATNPELAVGIAEGLKFWLAALPREMWALFGAGYLGYVGARGYDKRGQRELLAKLVAQ